MVFKHFDSPKPRSHCPGVRPSAAWQFVAGGPGRTGMNCEGIRVCSYIPGSATDQTRFRAKSRSVPVMLWFATVQSRFICMYVVRLDYFNCFQQNTQLSSIPSNFADIQYRRRINLLELSLEIIRAK